MNYLKLSGIVFDDSKHGFTKRGSPYSSFLLEIHNEDSSYNKKTLIRCLTWNEFRVLKGDKCELEGCLQIKNYKNKDNLWQKEVSILFSRANGKELETFKNTKATEAKASLGAPRSFVEAASLAVDTKWSENEDVPF